MRHEILSLSASHFQKVGKELRGQRPYSDPRKEQFRQELVSISENFIKKDFRGALPAVNLLHRRFLFHLFMPWAMALDDKNAYTLSREMRALLDNLCKIWVEESNKFIFATTDGDFSCLRYESDWDILMDCINRYYNVRPSYQLVIFRIPKHLHEDFLFVGSLYHEMGHFVEAYHNISDRVLDKLKARLSVPAEEKQIRDLYFPIIQSTYENGVCTNANLREKLLKTQLREYIADLFGTQYLGEHIGNHIEYVAAESMNEYDDEHPSPICRRKMEEAFLNNDRTNFVYADIVDEFAASNKPLGLRYIHPQNGSKLDKGEPIQIMNEDELHSLLWYGWEVYLRGPQAMANAQGNPTNVLSQYDFYLKLNEAIRESIKGFFNM